MAAAIPSGILKTFEGVSTFGAALLDLGVDKDRVEAVEAFWDKLNPFDEVQQPQQVLVRLQNLLLTLVCLVVLHLKRQVV